MRSTSRKWADTAAPRPSISPNGLKEHYSALFKRGGEKVELPDFSDLKQDSDLIMDEFFKSKAKLKTVKSPGPNGLRSELLKWGGSLLDCRMLDMFDSYWNGSAKIPRECVNAEYGFREDYSAEQDILTIRHCIRLASDKNKSIVLIFVHLKKAFDSLPPRAIIKQLIDLWCSWNIVHSISALLDSPVGRLRGSTESFIMERGVRKSSKEGPLLFNITFQLVLEEVYNLAPQIGITLVAKNGDEWKLGYIEYADDLCLITNTIGEAEELLPRLDTVLAKFLMEMATDKTQWMCLGEESERKLLHFGSKSIDKVHSYRYLGSPINTLGNATEAISGGIANGRRQLMKIGPILRSSVLAVQIKARLVEIFISPAIYYGLFTVVLRTRNNNWISALLNTVRRVIFGLNSRRRSWRRECL
ncbi:unnamed protein product [Hymenolepis diminuta]|uniref:Reverse transcriptase domain-containing protein n=1 Tax=Hymenolepis diminuta TaxID=6216 RepID=A0A564ZCN3_HYMDI|nr:unnamed protein product [Hymenolepis diminuta]